MENKTIKVYTHTQLLPYLRGTWFLESQIEQQNLSASRLPSTIDEGNTTVRRLTDDMHIEVKRIIVFTSNGTLLSNCVERDRSKASRVDASLLVKFISPMISLVDAS